MKRKIISLLLIAVLCLQLLPASVLAYHADNNEKPTVIIGTDGNPIHISDDWETAFPYGTFAFGVSEVGVEEGGDAAVIKIYRLGGSKGRASAFVAYIPAVLQISEDSKSYTNAAGSDDIVIEVEDALPIAQYQPLGKDPDPEPAGAVLTIEDYTGADVQDGDRLLTVPEEAERYQWYVCENGNWRFVNGANGCEFIAAGDQYAEYDFRCVYTVAGVSYCTDSIKGEVYAKPAAEVLPEMPEDLDLNPSQTFTTLRTDPGDPYLGYLFEVVFAEDEWVKDIRVTAPEDDISEAIKAGTFTIVDCKGGSLYDTANTLALAVFDNDAPEASSIGFVTTDLLVDKSGGKAELIVKRSGGTQEMLGLSYATVDGDAIAGEDYIASEGKLWFFGDITEQTISIPLKNDKIATEDTVSFTVVLSGLEGDSTGVCTLTDTVATVSLWNSNTAAAENLATMLHDNGSVDASGTVSESAIVAPVNAGAVSGTQLAATNPLAAEITYGGREMGLLSYSYGQGAIRFTRDAAYSGWKDWEYVARKELYTDGRDIADADGEEWKNSSKTDVGGVADSGGWKLESKTSTDARLDILNMSKLYQKYTGIYRFVVASGDHYINATYTYPWASVFTEDGNGSRSHDPRVQSNVTWNGNIITGFTYSYTTADSIDYNIPINSKATGLWLGLKREGDNDANTNASCTITQAALQRRFFANDLGLRIHTANDGNNGAGNAQTAPANAAALVKSSDPNYTDAYDSMKPTVSLVSGGVTNSGKLYVGSTIKVDLKNTASYTPYSGELLSSAIYLSDADGNILTKYDGIDGPKISKDGNSYVIEMLWDNMNASDLSRAYTVNVVMTRRQGLKFDITPSVDRLTDENGNPLANIDTAKINEGWDRFWDSAAAGINITDVTKNYIEVYYSAPIVNAPHFTAATSTIYILRNGKACYFDGETRMYLNADKAVLTDSNTSESAVKQIIASLAAAIGLENIQGIKFNRAPEDRILFNGAIYSGDKTIWLDEDALARSELEFKYYHHDYLSATSIMTATIDSLGLYLDVDRNGRIDGYYNENTGYFVLEKDENGKEKDMFVMFLKPGMDYDESLLAPVPVEWNSSGRATAYAQYFVKATYSMTPRSLLPEAGKEASKAQVMPAFVTSITNTAKYA